jgi:hypothetical protein
MAYSKYEPPLKHLGLRCDYVKCAADFTGFALLESLRMHSHVIFFQELPRRVLYDPNATTGPLSRYYLVEVLPLSIKYLHLDNA